MWIVSSEISTTRNNDEDKKNLAEKVAVVPSESKGISAAIARLMRRRSVIDIVERFPDETRTARGAGNEEFPPVDERRGRSGHYPFNRMNSKASTVRSNQ
jgi:hypothetical protein